MKQYFFRRIRMSFSNKLFVFLMGVFVLLTSFFSVFSLHSQQENFKKNLLREGFMIAGILADNARLGIFSMNNRQLEAAVSNVLGAYNVIGACIYDMEGQILQRKTAGPWEMTDICRKPERAVNDPSAEGLLNVSSFEDDEIVEFWSPVLTKTSKLSEDELYFEQDNRGRPGRTQRIGSVGVVFATTELQKNIRDMLITNLLVLFFLVFISCLATYFLVQGVTEPLNRLLKDIKSRGGMPEDRDDLGLISDTYSGLIRNLSESFATISTLNSSLEIKIAELEQEIAKRKQTEAALHDSEEKFRDISEGIAEGVAIVRDGIFVWLNKAFSDIFACLVDDLLGQEAAMLLPWPGQKAGSPWPSERLTGPGGQEPFLIEVRRKDGLDILLNVCCRPIIFEKQKAIQVIIRDVTERHREKTRRKELEIKALAQSKLASLGKIASGVAHEINQPLSYIRVVYESALQDIAKQRLDPAEMTVNFREALRQVGRITQITDHLRHFGRIDTSKFEQVQVPETLTNSLALMREILRLDNISLTQEIGEHLPSVFGNSVQLEQVFINLFQNSVDAMSESNDKRIRVSVQQAGEMLEICFSDSGPGIAFEEQKNIFEPFYSTKSMENRSGLGLAIVNSIIRDHHGRIAYRDLPGWGASFVINLPVSRDSGNGSSGALGQGPDNI
ncbi:MAG TPA: hypothetical protein DDY20_00960 [Desulfobulbaceae bacterium]|nr:hypothetical protein [Desulfobulbaceae bacterium]